MWVIYNQEKEKIGSFEVKSIHINKYNFLVSMYLIDGWYFSNWAGAEIYNIFHRDNNHRQKDMFSLPYQSIWSNYVCSERALNIGTEITSFISRLSGNPFIQKAQHHSYQIFNKNRKLNMKHKLLFPEELIELKKSQRITILKSS